MTDLMHLDHVTGTTGDSAGFDTGMIIRRRGQLGDLITVVSGVDADSPACVRSLYENCVEIDLDTGVLKVTDIGGEEVRKVGSCRNGNVVDKV